MPSATEFQVKLKGVVKSSPSLVLPLKNSTLLTVPSASEALAVSVIVAGAVKLLPLVGDVRFTAGAKLILPLINISIF